MEIDNDSIHTNKYLYGNTGLTWKTPSTIISNYYMTHMNMVDTYKEKRHMWILSQVASNEQLQQYTDFNEHINKDNNKIVHINFMNIIYETNKDYSFQVCGIDMHDFCYYYRTRYFKLSDTDTDIFIMNQANVLIKKLFGDNENIITLVSVQVYMIFQRYDKNKIELDISKESFYNLMTFSLGLFSKT